MTKRKARSAQNPGLRPDLVSRMADAGTPPAFVFLPSRPPARLRAQDFRAKVRLKRLRNRHRAVGLLVRFEQRDEQARQRGARAVERVAEAVLAVGILEFQPHAARL